VGLQYARGTRASFAVANWIRAQGYNAKAYPGPSAEALLLIPPAIASGLGELGKHGSIISRQFGAGVRLAGVTTTMPLVSTAPDTFDHHNDPHPRTDRDDPATVVVDQMSAQQAVEMIVAGLSPDQAEVVLLRIVAGLGVSEVAAIMGRSPTSIRVLCHRALRHLRDRFPEGQLIP